MKDKDRILAILIGIIIGFSIWIFNQYQIKIKQEKEAANILNEMKILEYKKKQQYIDNIKNNILSQIGSDKKTYVDLDPQINIKIKIYDYKEIYKKIYDIILNEDSVKRKVGYKSFEDTILNEKLSKLKEGVLHTKIVYNDGKEINYDYIPIDISCKGYGYCKKIIEKDINEVYQLDNNILSKEKVKRIVTKKVVLDLLNSDKTLYEYFNK